MFNSEFTLTSPMSVATRDGRPLLGLTIAWHPDLARIGEQFIATDVAALDLSRYLPLFGAPEKEALGLGHGAISRAPLRFERDEADGVTIVPPDSRMVVEVNGMEIDGPLSLSMAQIEAGAVLGLGRIVLVCLHWMRSLPQSNAVDGFLGVGSAAIRMRGLIRQVAASDTTVLLLGETGTGKEVAARAIHALSTRAGSSMVSVNMAALNESLAAADLFGASTGAYTGAQAARGGFFAQAQGSTLFLDEIGNTPAAIQPMLLRVLETGEYRPLGAQHDQRSTARLIAATDQNLYGGGFNLALLRRLESFIIHLPPLRARREDIGLLIAHLLRAPAAQGEAGLVLPTALVTQFLCYDWPGNIRQLTHVLKRTVLALRMGETPQFRELVDLPAPAAAAAISDAAGPSTARTRTRLSDVGEQQVLQAMIEHGWHIQGAAQALGLSRPSMYKLLEAHPGIRRADQIAPDEIAAAWSLCGGNVEDCAARLQTPAEALRRHIRALKLSD